MRAGWYAWNLSRENARAESKPSVRGDGRGPEVSFGPDDLRMPAAEDPDFTVGIVKPWLREGGGR